MSDRSLEETVSRLVARSYLRVLLGVGWPGRPLEDLSASERAELLAPWSDAMSVDVRAILTVVSRGQALALGRLRESLHAAPGIDHEMLDEAIVCASERAE